MQYTQVTSPTWANAEHTAINCRVTFVSIGEVPFTASQSDQYAHSTRIFNETLAGNYGVISEFVPHVPTAEEIAYAAKAEQTRLDTLAAKADNKLAAIADMTPTQVRAWVEANVNNLADAKDAIATLAVAVSVLSRRL